MSSFVLKPQKILTGGATTMLSHFVYNLDANMRCTSSVKMVAHRHSLKTSFSTLQYVFFFYISSYNSTLLRERCHTGQCRLHVKHNQIPNRPIAELPSHDYFREGQIVHCKQTSQTQN